MMSPSEAFDRVDALVDTNPLELRDLVWGILGRIDALSGRSPVEDDLLDNLREFIEEQLS